jgi:hypothetical protein
LWAFCTVYRPSSPAPLQELPRLLLDEAAWHGLFIDYHPPTVERLWLPWSKFRVLLHRIYPCAPGEALFHAHPWPSALRVLAGEYEMAVSYGKGQEPPPVAALMIARGDFRYEMTDPDASPFGRFGRFLQTEVSHWSAARLCPAGFTAAARN